MNINKTDLDNYITGHYGEDQFADEDIQKIYIPAMPQHNGFSGINVYLYWVCPVCGLPRGTIKHNVRSYDGSRILYCDGWSNSCGHVDKYEAVVNEAKTNGLNHE